MDVIVGVAEGVLVGGNGVFVGGLTVGSDVVGIRRMGVFVGKLVGVSGVEVGRPANEFVKVQASIDKNRIIQQTSNLFFMIVPLFGSL